MKDQRKFCIIIERDNCYVRFLSVKKWLLRKKHQIELARKRGWKGYWVCLKGTTLLFYPCDSHESRAVETAPKHLIIVDGAIMQPIPEHPKRDYIFCLSTAFGDAYLFQVIRNFEIFRKILHVWDLQAHCHDSSESNQTKLKTKLVGTVSSGTRELGEQYSLGLRRCVCSSSRKNRYPASSSGRDIPFRQGYRIGEWSFIFQTKFEYFEVEKIRESIIFSCPRRTTSWNIWPIFSNPLCPTWRRNNRLTIKLFSGRKTWRGFTANNFVSGVTWRVCRAANCLIQRYNKFIGFWILFYSILIF